MGDAAEQVTGDVAFRSASELCEALAARRISSRELLELYLDRIERLDAGLNAVVTLDAERSREEAAAADDALVREGPRGPLHGLPMTVKDSIETAGLRTTSGAKELAGHVPASDAVAVARLRAAGAIVFGKTNLPAFAADCQTYNDLFGTTVNPWNADRTPGGSSGGAAAAIAAGLTGLELGSDLGGSIRLPAHFCGVYGLKPTWGTVPQRGHIPPQPGVLSELDVATLGPLARSADDLDLALDVLAGPDTPRAVGWRLELPRPRRRRLADYRVAAYLDDPYCSVDTELVDLLADTVRALAAAGARVDDSARPPSLAEGHEIAQRLVQGAVSVALPPEEFERLCADAANRSPDDTSAPARWARNVTQRARDLAFAVEQRAQLAAAWGRFFADHDLLLCPVTPSAAFAHDRTPDVDARTILVNGRPRPYGDQFAWLQAVGVAHLPAVVAPIGRTRDGLPVGVQIVAPYLEDRTAVDGARYLAAVIGGYVPPPGW
jgi:amidase